MIFLSPAYCGINEPRAHGDNKEHDEQAAQWQSSARRTVLVALSLPLLHREVWRVGNQKHQAFMMSLEHTDVKGSPGGHSFLLLGVI